MYRLPNGQIAVEGNDARPRRTAAFGSLVALALAILYFGLLAPTILSPLPVAIAVAVFVAAGGAILGGLVSRLLDLGVRGSILNRYRNWVTIGETLVIVEVNVNQARAALSILRESEDARPQTFIIRPHRRVAGRVAEFQRGERFSSERLPRYATRLADQHAGALRYRRPQPLWERLRDCERTIDAITLDLAQAVQLEQSVSVSAEWLLDNAYVIQRQLADVRRNLSHQLYNALPILETGARRGEPRAYDLAAELVAHTDAELIETDVVSFLNSYQKVSSLSMGELWALPLLLRLALAQNLSYLATSIDEQQHEFEWADFWANRLLVAARRAPDQLLTMLAELSREHSDPSAVFADRLIDQLQGEALVLGPVLAWLELKWGSPVFETIAAEEHRHVADQTTIANGIGSLRLLARLDWRDVFEQTSQVEAVLRSEPADVYRRMDFPTRDRYRHAVEEIARRSRATEVETALAAVAAAQSNGRDYQGHVGYYLIDSGRAELESQVGYHPTVPQAIRLNVLRKPTLSYLGAVSLATVGVLGATLALAVAAGPLPPLLFAALGLLALLPASELAIQVVNFAVTRTLRPQPPPKLSFDGADGIPDEWRTLVVVPTLLVSPASIREDLARLETRYLANRDPNLRFALLADLTDASSRETPLDAELIATATRGIEALNRQYARVSDRSDPIHADGSGSGSADGGFVLFFRPRRWSKTERCWMGWERKRGKIEELNSWLLGVHTPAVNGRGMDAVDALRPIAGDASRLVGTRLVITLDADTQLPHGTALRLIGTLAHPLNRPRLSPDGRRVDGGYTIIQPRVSPSLPSATATRFSRIFADAIGVDPYTQAVSDLYQDLAGEGSYYGKGIYDVQTFHRVLGGRFPEATLLSHDLLEGAYVRVGMATDVELFDAFPSDYVGEARRRHRWVRGDWQIAAWCGASVPGADGRREPNPIGVLNRWKINDNLRRSLVPAASVALLLFAWALLPSAAVAATVLVALGLLTLPALGLVFWLPAQPAAALTSRRVWRNQGIVWLRALVNGALLPHQAIWTLDAIGRTLARKLVTRRDLLQWQSYNPGRRTVGGFDRRLVGHLSLIGLAAGGWGFALPLTGSVASLVAAPFLLLWLGAPLVVIWLSGAYTHRPEPALSGSDRKMLRRMARETWRYFDDFVGPDTNWLPPDNYQEAPRAELAERTSPTNVGLWLLATLAANDLGYLTPEEVAARGEATLDTIDRLELFEGHLLNWYNTRTLDPLYPRYVSTVDSGNLLASLWTLVQGYRGMLAQPRRGAAALDGLADTLELVLIHEWPALVSPAGKPTGAGIGRLGASVDELHRLFNAAPEEPAEIVRRLRAAVEPARALTEALREALGEAAAVGLDDSAESVDDGAADVSPAYWATQLERQLAAWIDFLDRDLATALEARLERLIRRVERLADGMNLAFLYDPKRRLFTIGYNVSDRRADSSYYDLLASEARVASLVAIAQNQVPVEHWFSLGRPFGRAGGHRVLFSWSGTMFEYLMPLLLTRAYPHTLLEEAVREAVGLQIDYGYQQGVPWGISESAFAAVDVNQIYQYQAFGVPGLGLKRGLADDLVIAPYASALALLVDRRASLSNLKRLINLGLRGDYGFYDAIDFTSQRQPSAAGRGAIVRNYMVHHEGMTLLALDNVLNAGAMPRRFHADRRVQAVESLLFETAPVAPLLVEATERSEAPARVPVAAPNEPSVVFDGPTPTTHLLGNGEYTVLLTSAGGGFSRWRDLDVTRWRADMTLDAHGAFVYLKDLDSGAIWSTTHQPTRRVASRQLARFAPDRAEFERRDSGIGVASEIAVSSKHAAELRRLTLANYSGRTRRLEVTSYVELALAAHGADLAHPAFSRLFVETESLPGRNALIARRKPRSPGDPSIYAAHVLVLPGVGSADRADSATASESIRIVGHETDRARFVGRGRGLDNPRALETDLSGSVGPVLDPIFSLRCAVTLEPGERIELAFVTGAAADRAGIVDLVEKYENLHVVHRAIEAAVSQGQASARHLRVTAEDLRCFQQLAGPLIFPNARLRASEAQLRRNRLGQSGLWPQGISGDLPIALVTVGDRRDLDVVREALLAHAYWRLLGFRADLVILNEEAGGYEQRLQGELRRTIQRYAPSTPLDGPGGIFLRPVDLLSVEEQTLLYAVARVMLVAARGPLVQQLGIQSEATVLPPPLAITRRAAEEPSAPLPFLELPYFNGLGGFSADGREYTTYLGPGVQTPAPWVNVLANPAFGAIVSESGTGFTWAANSQSNRLSPWSNDPVSDPVGDAIYIRDEHLGVFWSPTAAPIREIDAYRARHGQGYTLFEHNSHAIEQELTTFVPLDDSGGTPIRIQRLRLRNASSRRRRLSVFSYTDWVLGSNREETQAHVITNWDAGSRTLLARNYYHPDFGGRIAFASASPAPTAYTADRTEFLGRNGSTARPAALLRQALSGRDGAGLDPAAALQVVVEIDPDESVDVIFLLGEVAEPAAARRLVERFRDPVRVDEALQETRATWDRLLDAVQVETPDLAVNFQLNRWLLYQTLSCRIWGRSAFYQSGGAIGFRDQLQDCLALVYTAPDIARRQILTAAARQFVEGDVQHWWHPQSGAGVRTRMSDDLLWLPYAVARYVQTTGDAGILDEAVPFIEGPVLADGQHEAYFVPAVSLEIRSLLDHCRRAIARGDTAGAHGLPLIGTGDWNDGLSRVGGAGRGESIWLAWFLADVLGSFADLISGRGLDGEVAGYRSRAQEIAAAVEAHGWDGEWYRRAYFDDGTPLGSAESESARIDSIPQSWAVISGLADRERAARALRAVDEHLVRRDVDPSGNGSGIVLLFTPPFDDGPIDPGYIKGYPPGVRENGGQYTHAAIWVAMAHARLGDGARAVEILRMLNPVEHARTPEAVERYRVEPYVVAADVYSLEGHVGQGGWTWYTGSAGWMYRVWIEEVLGLRVRGGELTIDPAIPPDWPTFTLRCRLRGASYEIRVENPNRASRGVARVEVDGWHRPDGIVPLGEDTGHHFVQVWLG